MNNSNELRIVIYTRNTAIEQPQGRYLYRDVYLLKCLYERNGYPINKIYREPSSKIRPSERPVLKKLLKDEHLATKRDMPLSNLAKLIIGKEQILKGGEWNGSTNRNAS
ncbi:hypothetical protein [Virgibacillus oceani]|uniref:Uncharacterized protein n=1 Tax=Virgibacillus oceani TaxID=1479511 RepID=A0A917HEI9_9BACI|nr:hypothetical protein [Virgibacillus oceani]GGG76703.1 hypothetical protein GCM10011398_22150 [Virgibacillus oceani]